MAGRWVGLSYDGKIITGWGAFAKTEQDVRDSIPDLKNEAGVEVG